MAKIKPLVEKYTFFNNIRNKVLLDEGHKEILQSECYEEYGYPSYIR